MQQATDCERPYRRHTLEKHLISCAEQAAQHKYKLLKIYMMLGLPDEQDEDIDELIRFCTEISKIHPIALGIAPFVPKRTRQWMTMVLLESKWWRRNSKTLKKDFAQQAGKAQIRSTSVKWAWVEYMLAQGGSDMGYAVLNSVHNGGKFAHWKRALNERDPQKMAPWKEKS